MAEPISVACGAWDDLWGADLRRNFYLSRAFEVFALQRGQRERGLCNSMAACHHRSFRRWLFLLQKGEGRVSLGIAQGRQYPTKKGRRPQVQWAAAP